MLSLLECKNKIFLQNNSNFVVVNFVTANLGALIHQITTPEN